MDCPGLTSPILSRFDWTRLRRQVVPLDETRELDTTGAVSDGRDYFLPCCFMKASARLWSSASGTSSLCVARCQI